MPLSLHAACFSPPRGIMTKLVDVEVCQHMTGCSLFCSAVSEVDLKIRLAVLAVREATASKSDSGELLVPVRGFDWHGTCRR